MTDQPETPPAAETDPGSLGTTAPTKAPKASKKAYHHPNLRQALLDEALTLISARRGVHFSLRELAGIIGVTHASVYRHFGDRAELLDALTDEGFRRLASYQRAEMEKAPPTPLDRLLALGLAYVRFAVENNGFFNLMFNARPGEVPEKTSRDGHFDEALDTLIEAIRACQDDGTVIAGDPRRLAGFLIMGPHGFAQYTVQGHRPNAPPERQPIFPDLDAFSRLNLIPLMTRPPTPDEIARAYFPPAD